jgi:hypothetical protein
MYIAGKIWNFRYKRWTYLQLGLKFLIGKWRLFCLLVPCSRIPSPSCTSKVPIHTEYISGFLSYLNGAWNTYWRMMCLEEAQIDWKWYIVLELAKIRWVSGKESTSIAVLFIVSINFPCTALSNVKGNLTNKVGVPVI